MLTPALAERPLELGEIDTTEGDGMAAWARGGQFTPFTAIANVTGQPAISLPLDHGDDGLPLCVQLFGRAGRRGHAAGARRPARGRAAVGGPAGRRSRL